MKKSKWHSTWSEGRQFFFIYIEGRAYETEVASLETSEKSNKLVWKLQVLELTSVICGAKTSYIPSPKC